MEKRLFSILPKTLTALQHCSRGQFHEDAQGGLSGWEVGALAWGSMRPLRALGGQGPRPFKKEPVPSPIL